MFEFIGFLIVAFFAFKILRYFISSPESNCDRAERRYMENPTDINYKLMVAARIRLEKKRNN